MKLVRVSPFNGFESVVRRVNRMMSDAENGGSLFNNDSFFNGTSLVPRVDIAEDQTSFHLSAELAGLSKEDIKISVNEDRILTLSGEKKREEKKEDKNYSRVERRYGQFSRSFNLPENVDEDKIEAKFENGVLHLSIPKTEPVKPNVKEITVR